MRSVTLILLPAALLLTSCMLRTNRQGGLEVVPILPEIVVLDDESYYTHNGYHYFYTNDRWVYSTSRSGPRHDLPRSHWPREVKHRRR